MEKRNDELTIDELDLASGGSPNIGIDYSHSSKGTAKIQWADNGGTWVMTEGKNGLTWVPN
jgi:hypothetical protein